MTRGPAKSSSLRARIFGSYLLIFLIFLALTANGFLRTRRLNRELALLTESYLPIYQRVQNINNFYLQEDDAPLGTSHGGPPSLASLQASYLPKLFEREVGRAAETAAAQAQQVSDEREELELSRLSGELRALLKRNAGYQQHLAEAGEATGNSKETLEGRRSALIEERNQLRGAVVGLARRLETKVHFSLYVTRAQERKAALWTTLFSIAALLLAVGYGLFTLLLLRPLRKLSDTARGIAAGELSRRVRVERNDELGALASDFNRMAEAVESRQRQLTSLTASSRGIIDAVRAGIMVSDLEGIITTANPAAARLLGLRREAMGGQKLERLPIGPAAAMMALSAKEVLRLNAPRQSGPYRLQLGKLQRLLHVQQLPLPGAEEERLCLHVLDDITESTETSIRRIESERLATIGQLASQITHEIRNPLNSLGLNLELLRDEIGAPEEHPEAMRLLNLLQAEIDRLSGISENYLEVARAQAQKKEIRVSDLLRELVSFLRQEMSSRQIAMREALLCDDPPISADPNQLRQLFLNLLKNAAEAVGREGEIEIRQEVSGAEISVSVRDNGPGIDPSQLPMIFTPFYSTKDGGTGLGLAICQRIAAAHGGRIEAVSQPEGTTFTVRLPRLDAAAVNGDNPPTQPWAHTR